MGIYAKKGDLAQKHSKAPVPTSELSKPELGFLLHLIKESTFEGKDVEVVFNTAVKLQSMYNK